MRGLRPGGAVVGADLDGADPRGRRPRTAGQHLLLADRERRTEGELERAFHHLCRKRRLPGRVAAAREDVLRRVPEREERRPGNFDLADPLDARDPDPAGHNRAEREAVIEGKRLAVHLVGDRKSTRLNSSHEWISYA